MKNITNNYYSYQGLVDTFEVETLLEGEAGDYQGDLFFLLRDGDRYGFLVFGYGSCSGCDALEGCYGNPKAMEELRDELWESVRWETGEALAEFFTTKDEKLEWWGYGSGYEDFKAEAVKILRG